MSKKKINFQLVNMALAVIIVFFLYRTGNLWIGILGKLWQIIFPFFIAFVLAYALYPFTIFLRKKGIPKKFSNILAVLLVLGILVFIAVMVFPILTSELTNLFSGIITFIKEISLDYDLDLGPLQNALSGSFNDIISSLGKHVSDGAITAINVSLSFLSTALIVFSASIYFLFDMDSIRKKVKRLLKNKSRKLNRYIRAVDAEMRSYLSGFLTIAFISIFEYGIAYALIGHPSAFY